HRSIVHLAESPGRCLRCGIGRNRLNLALVGAVAVFVACSSVDDAQGPCLCRGSYHVNCAIKIGTQRQIMRQEWVRDPLCSEMKHDLRLDFLYLAANCAKRANIDLTEIDARKDILDTAA